ncbi:MAG: Rieske (2Fe-2S) protein [Sandaracinaceae bacterium]|nr:Rieske (2Fe-2S) protein [Sandaracinaceae bacterium]MDW8246534.1 Rieske (2Fe-2S) protein [Sandaracinaceae bacterium]
MKKALHIQIQAKDLPKEGEARVFPISPPRLSCVLVRDEEGSLHAYLNECQHLPIPLDGGVGSLLVDEDGLLVCRTHGAAYRPKDGLCVRGPCIGKALRPLSLHEGEGSISIVFEDTPQRMSS